MAWLIDLTRQQIWVWQGGDLPTICSGTDTLPDLDLGLELTVEAVIAMTRQR
jgi:Uma2 family endonuclease